MTGLIIAVLMRIIVSTATATTDKLVYHKEIQTTEFIKQAHICRFITSGGRIRKIMSLRLAWAIQWKERKGEGRREEGEWEGLKEEKKRFSKTWGQLEDGMHKSGHSLLIVLYTL